MENREQPRPQVRAGLEAVGRAERLQIRVLHQILGIGRHAGQPQRRAVQAVERRQRLGLEALATPDVNPCGAASIPASARFDARGASAWQASLRANCRRRASAWQAIPRAPIGGPVYKACRPKGSADAVGRGHQRPPDGSKCRARCLQAPGRNSKIQPVSDLLSPFPRYLPMRTRVPLPRRSSSAVALLVAALVAGYASAPPRKRRWCRTSARTTSTTTSSSGSSTPPTTSKSTTTRRCSSTSSASPATRRAPISRSARI